MGISQRMINKTHKRQDQTDTKNKPCNKIARNKARPVITNTGNHAQISAGKKKKQQHTRNTASFSKKYKTWSQWCANRLLL